MYIYVYKNPFFSIFVICSLKGIRTTCEAFTIFIIPKDCFVLRKGCSFTPLDDQTILDRKSYSLWISTLFGVTLKSTTLSFRINPTILIWTVIWFHCFHRSTFCDFEPCLSVFMDLHPHPLSDWNNYSSKAFAHIFYYKILKNFLSFLSLKNQVTF